tara:strand:- start:1217 stop:1393 length:177 start_codon:yes stop_codon:yes gene_type:complete
MTQQEALESLVNAAKVAQQRGAYSLEEASVIHDAIMKFATPSTAAEESEEKSEKKKKS